MRASLKDRDELREEDMGEILFAISSISAISNMDLEDILNKETHKFIEKYTKL